MEKISIIAPVYNIEDYLGKCLDSILNQTFKNYELIIVDDGSTDSSGNIADAYAKMDSRIMVVHKTNGGAASARNAGLEIASGKYVYFPDPDDWLEKDYLKKMYEAATINDAELVISGFHMDYFFDTNEVSFIETVPAKCLSTTYEVRKNIHRYFDNMMVAVPWNKLYKKEYLDKYNLKFPNVKWDDLHFNLEVLRNIQNVAIIHESGYHFLRTRPGSETTLVFDKYLFKKRKEQFEHIVEVYSYWGIKDQDIWEALYEYYLGRIFQCIQEISGSSQSINEQKKSIHNILNDSLTLKALNGYGSDNLSLWKNCIFKLLSTGNINLILSCGKLTNSFKNNFNKEFTMLKNRIINNANRVRG